MRWGVDEFLLRCVLVPLSTRSRLLALTPLSCSAAVRLSAAAAAVHPPTPLCSLCTAPTIHQLSVDTVPAQTQRQDTH